MGGELGPAVRGILIALVVVFFLQNSFLALSRIYLPLIPVLVWKKGFLWQFVTYIFLHGGVMHLFLNGFMLWMFGSELEHRWGSNQFLRYFFVTGVGAGLCSALADPGSPVPIVGASGSLYGLLLAYALFYPDRVVLVSFLIPMKMKHMVWLLVGVEFFAQVSGSQPGIAHVAHLGGAGVGYLYLKKDDFYQRWRNRYYRERLRRRRERGDEEA